MIYRRQWIEWEESTGKYAGNAPGLLPPEMPQRRYAFRGHRVARATNFKKENVRSWSVKALVDALRKAEDGDIDYVAEDRAQDARASVWKFAGGLWVCNIESGSTCGHGAAASRARAFGKQKVGEIRKVWTDAEILVESDEVFPFLDVERFARIYGKLHLAFDIHVDGDMGKEGPTPPRYGRYLCLCGDYASYGTCALVAAPRHFALRPSEDSWALTQKIRKWKDEAPAEMHSLRRDIQKWRKTAAGAYRGELGRTPASQIEDRDIEDAAPLLVRRISIRTSGIRF